MGHKATKMDVDHFLSLAGHPDRPGTSTPERCSSKKALARYLASLSDMANRGTDNGPLDMARAATGPHGDISPDTFRRMSAQLRKKLEAEVPVNEDARKQLELLKSLQNQDDDSKDWESMRGWLVWCMHANLDDDDDDEFALPTRRRLSRQTSLDASRGRKLSHQDNFDVNRDGRMSNQSSLESNAET